MVAICSTTSVLTKTSWNREFTELWRLLHYFLANLALLSLHLWTNKCCSWETKSTTTICTCCLTTILRNKTYFKSNLGTKWMNFDTFYEMSSIWYNLWESITYLHIYWIVLLVGFINFPFREFLNLTRFLVHVRFFNCHLV